MWQLPVAPLVIAPLVIEPGQTHVWLGLCVAAPIDLAWCESLLTAGEMTRARRFATETLRRRYLQAHTLLHQLLRGYTQADQQCDLFYPTSGKPILRAPQLEPRLEFNLSHAGEMVVIALARGHQVGVDVEVVRPLDELNGLIAASCTRDETAFLATLDDDARLRAFYWLWTRKEAWLKLLGVGLHGNLAATEVHGDPPGITLLDVPLVEMEGVVHVGALALPVEVLPNIKIWDALWQGD